MRRCPVADFLGVTACNPARVTDVEAVKTFIEQYSFGEVTVEVEPGGLLWVYGYDWLDVYRYTTDEGGEVQLDCENAYLDEFLEGLKPFIAEGEKLEIGCVGNEKCRYVSAMKVTVTRDEVKYEHLGT